MTGCATTAIPSSCARSTAVQDFWEPPLTLVGAPAGDCADVLRELCGSIATSLHVVPYSVAESVKYLSNAYHAVKLAFANEAGGVLAAYGIDAPAAFRLFCEDRVLNISSAYLRPGFAFGGSCSAKDMRGFFSLGDRKAIPMPLLSHVTGQQQRHCRPRVRADNAARAPKASACSVSRSSKAPTICAKAALVQLAEKLIGKGYKLRIFDRSVNVPTLVGRNRCHAQREIPHLERLMVG